MSTKVVCKDGRVNTLGFDEEDFIGKEFGYLTPVSVVPKHKPGATYLKCLCSGCGEYKNVKATSLRTRISTCCGCKKAEKRLHSGKLIGKKVGMLTVVKFDKLVKSRYYYWCECECSPGKLVSYSADRFYSENAVSCGCNSNKKFVAESTSRIGQTFNKLLVTGVSEKHKTPCECLACHEQCKILTSTLLKGAAYSCGCVENPFARKTVNTAYREISGAYWSAIQNGALQRDVPFNITIEEAYELYHKQSGICPFTGQAITFGDIRHINKSRTLSFDRIDSSKPYSINNCEWVSKVINGMKWSLTKEEFIRLCKLVINPLENAETIQSEIIPGVWHIINKAKKPFLFSKDEAHYMLKKQKFCCAITGQQLILPKDPSELKGGIRTASVDRIDSSKGYIIENVWWVHKDVNFAKGNKNILEFIGICRLVSEHHKKV